MDLKFRAKANIDNEWKYASNIHKVILDNTNEELWVIHPKGEKIKHLGDGYIKYRPLVVDKETIGQYTGLKDIYDKEIFTGDIVELYDTEKDVITNHLIEHLDYTKYMNLEIIGNIHENKELLK